MTPAGGGELGGGGVGNSVVVGCGSVAVGWGNVWWWGGEVCGGGVGKCVVVRGLG